MPTLIQSFPQFRQEVGQSTQKVERWHYATSEADPPALGTFATPYFLIGRVSEAAPNGDGNYWTLTYSTTLGGEGASPSLDKDDGAPYYTADDDGIEVPISRHPSYRAHWDHDLIGFFVEGESELTATPAFWETSTTPKITADNAKTYQFVQADYPAHEYTEDGRLGYWVMIEPRTKPGVENFIAPALRVTEIKYYTSENDANLNIGATVGTKAAPAKLFGGPATADQWLVRGMRSYPDGRRWAVQKIYQTAGYINGAWQEWDTDVYLPVKA